MEELRAEVVPALRAIQSHEQSREVGSLRAVPARAEELANAIENAADKFAELETAIRDLDGVTATTVSTPGRVVVSRPGSLSRVDIAAASTQIEERVSKRIASVTPDIGLVWYEAFDPDQPSDVWRNVAFDASTARGWVRRVEDALRNFTDEVKGLP
jgi:hypothetical protein